jgi:ubiquinone/menaquinone biosynthesis C-methylase UbiE
MYEHEYEAMYDLEDVYWWFIARRKLVQEIVGEETSGRAGVRLLDVGCGTGSNLAALAARTNSVGIDMSTEALSFCRRRGIEAVAHSRVEALPFPDASFEVVTALDMLEHTDDDLAALAELRRVTSPGGLLLITVPAYGFLWSEHDEALKHRRRYTAYELRNKLTVSGFAVERTSYFITSLFFPILAARVLQGIRKRSTHPQTSVRLLPKWLNASLVGLLDVERRIVRHINLPFGVTIVALARPRD